MARAAASLLIAGLGSLSAVAVVSSSSNADEPIPTAVVTMYRTVTEERLYQSQSIRWWANRAVANRRLLNSSREQLARQRITLGRIRRSIRARWTPTVRYALSLARAAYGIDQTRRAYCESTLNPFAVSPGGHMGILQFAGSTWRSTPYGNFSPFDPVAAALAGGWMIRAGRSGEWSCGL